jgi:peroxiredoxin
MKLGRQGSLAQTFGLGYPLLSDDGPKIARSFGVKRPGLLPNARTTFVIDSDRRVLSVVSNELNMNTHADRALEVLRRRPTTRSRPAGGATTRAGQRFGVMRYFDPVACWA